MRSHLRLVPEPSTPTRSALDFITVAPDTEGLVVVTVTDGNRGEVELEFTPEEAAILCGLVADAVELAEEMGR
jgi:hypothetical protein